MTTMSRTNGIPVVRPDGTGATNRDGAPAKHPWIALIVLVLPVLLISIDTTVLAFAVPEIARAIRPSGLQQLWIVDVYPLVIAGLLITMGTLGDRIGRRRLLLIGASGFAVVSVIASFAPNAETLIAARAALGFFGAMLMPPTLSLLRNVFVDPTQRRLAIAIWAASFSGGAALGPILGGLLLEHFHWGSVFLLAVPLLLPLLVLGPIFVPESRDPAPSPIDPVSIVMSMVGMSSLVYGLKTVATSGGVLLAAGAFVLGIAGLGLFVRRQRRLEQPMIEMSLFRNPAFSGAVSLNVLANLSLVGFIYFLAQHLQLVLGLDPFAAGLAMVPACVATILGGLFAVRLVRRFLPVTVVVAGLVLGSIGFLVVGAGSALGAGLTVTLVGAALLGSGIGLAETISSDTILAVVPAEKSGAASGISETGFEVGAVLGTTVLGGIMTAVYQRNVDLPAGLDARTVAVARETLGGAVDAAGSLPELFEGQLIASARAAFEDGALVTTLIGAVVMLAAALLAHRTLRSVRV